MHLASVPIGIARLRCRSRADRVPMDLDAKPQTWDRPSISTVRDRRVTAPPRWKLSSRRCRRSFLAADRRAGRDPLRSTDAGELSGRSAAGAMDDRHGTGARHGRGGRSAVPGRGSAAWRVPAATDRCCSVTENCRFVAPRRRSAATSTAAGCWRCSFTACARGATGVIGDFTDLAAPDRARRRSRRRRDRAQSAARAVRRPARTTAARIRRTAGCFSIRSTSTSRRSRNSTHRAGAWRD